MSPSRPHLEEGECKNCESAEHGRKCIVLAQHHHCHTSFQLLGGGVNNLTLNHDIPLEKRVSGGNKWPLGSGEKVLSRLFNVEEEEHAHICSPRQFT